MLLSLRVRYHYCCHNNRPVLHGRAVVRKAVLILDQHKFVYVVPVADLKRDDERVTGIMKY